MKPAEYAAALPLGLSIDLASARGKAGELYIFQSGPYMKFGISASGWRRRLETIRCDNPFKVSKVAVRRVPLCSLRYAERYMHQMLASYHHSREWFLVDKKVALDVLKRGVAVASLIEERLEGAYAEAEKKRRSGTNLTQRRKVTPKPTWSKWGKRLLYPKVTANAG